jgi:hypothetical protein
VHGADQESQQGLRRASLQCLVRGGDCRTETAPGGFRPV